MICPKCNSNNTIIIDGKRTDKGNYRRYRRCIDCQHTFTTIEYHVERALCRKDKPVIREGKTNLIYYNDDHGLLRVKNKGGYKQWLNCMK